MGIPMDALVGKSRVSQRTLETWCCNEECPAKGQRAPAGSRQSPSVLPRRCLRSPLEDEGCKMRVGVATTSGQERRRPMPKSLNMTTSSKLWQLTSPLGGPGSNEATYSAEKQYGGQNCIYEKKERTVDRGERQRHEQTKQSGSLIRVQNGKISATWKFPSVSEALISKFGLAYLRASLTQN
jgi:hypothetical protein